MAPKKEKAPKKAPQPASGGSDGPPAPPSSQPPTPVDMQNMDKVNAKLFVGVANDVNTIRCQWPDIHDKDPLAIDESLSSLSGYQAVFWEHSYKTAIQATGKYKSSINFMWINMLFTPTPGVPIQESRVDGLMEYYFKEPAPYPVELIIAVPDKEYAPTEHKGALVNVNVEEMKMAYLKAIARDIDRKKKSAVERWRHSLLTVTAEFRVLSSEDDIYFTAVNMREDITTKYHELARTAYQRVHEICLFKQRKEKSLGALSAKRVAEEFNARATMVPRPRPGLHSAPGLASSLHSSC